MFGIKGRRLRAFFWCKKDLSEDGYRSALFFIVVFILIQWGLIRKYSFYIVCLWVSFLHHLIKIRFILFQTIRFCIPRAHTYFHQFFHFFYAGFNRWKYRFKPIHKNSWKSFCSICRKEGTYVRMHCFSSS